MKDLSKFAINELYLIQMYLKFASNNYKDYPSTYAIISGLLFDVNMELKRRGIYE